jgi:hypothetical protein
MENRSRRNFLKILGGVAAAVAGVDQAEAHLKPEGSLPTIDTLVKENESFLLELSRFADRYEHDMGEYILLLQRFDSFVAMSKKRNKAPNIMEQSQLLASDFNAFQSHLELSIEIASMMKVGLDNYAHELSVGENLIEIKDRLVVYKEDYPKIFDTLLDQANQILQYRNFINETIENLRNWDVYIDSIVEDTKPVFGEEEDSRFG